MAKKTFKDSKPVSSNSHLEEQLADVQQQLDKLQVQGAKDAQEIDELKTKIITLTSELNTAKKSNQELATLNSNYIKTIKEQQEETDAVKAKNSLWIFLALFFILSTIISVIYQIIT